MKQKKITASHIIVYCAWLILVIYTAFVLGWVFTSPERVTVPIATILGGIDTMLAGVTGYITKAYYKKSETENQIKLQVGLVQAIIELQIKYPWLNLLASQDVNKILSDTKNTLQKNTQKNYEAVVLEDISTRL